jgi:hypothetical protein
MKRTCHELSNVYYYDYLVLYYLHVTMIVGILELSTILTVVYFHRIKINHDSH